MNLRLTLPALLLATVCTLSAAPASTARVYTVNQLRAVLHTTFPNYMPFFGDSSYAEVKAARVPSFYLCYKSGMHANGVKYGERFDCDHCAAFYVAQAQIRFARDTWRNRDAAQTLALGVLWYQPTPATAHAIVVAVTDNGVLFVDPQTGEVLRPLIEMFRPTLLVF